MGHRKFVCDPHCQVNWSWSWNASLGMYVRVREWIVWIVVAVVGK